jgi:hypothetical protein
MIINYYHEGNNQILVAGMSSWGEKVTKTLEGFFFALKDYFKVSLTHTRHESRGQIYSIAVISNWGSASQRTRSFFNDEDYKH